ncbi:MAG TPA: C25 family cysteine peptidase, partial [Acidimicrobiales bacterium]|nr:C25 family cysteine peptidase [Acidimicrobiales bacterium]
MAVRVAVVAAAPALAALGPLLDAYRAGGAVVDGVDPGAGGVPAPEALLETAGAADAVVLVVPRARSPRTVVPGPTLPGAGGGRVPVGVVADVGPEGLSRFATAAAAVHRRPHAAAAPSASVAVLAQRDPRYLDLAERILRLLGESAPATPRFTWTGAELIRDDLVAGLGTGLGLAVYVGHGRPIGWVGYRGTRAHHLGDLDHPVGAVLSLACSTASRRRTGLSFAEALPLQGSAAACLGAVGPTRHIDNARWALRLVQGVAAGCRSVGELVALAEPESTIGRAYRILGDPLAPLADEPGAAGAAERLS